jgi:hypothetical protein
MQGARIARNEAYFFIRRIACPGEGRGGTMRNAADGLFKKPYKEARVESFLLSWMLAACDGKRI